MKESIYPIPENFSSSHINEKQYNDLYKQSIDSPSSFWDRMAKEHVSWYSEWEQVFSGEFSNGNVHWFSGAKLNVSYNCIDRHLPENANKTAILWESDDPMKGRSITFNELKIEVCRLANALKSRGIRKGDRVCIYMPMIPEAIYSMLACARIGVIHSVVFAGFSPEALKERILDSDCCALITSDEGIRGGKKVPLKSNADKAMSFCPNIQTCLVVKRTDAEIQMKNERDFFYRDLISNESEICEPEPMEAEDPLFILYTSGSTGKPKGVLHSTGGYLLQATMTFKYIFDYQERDIYWCTADVGWITGHTYIVYGPLSNCATSLVFEGIPTFPSAGRFWEVIDKHQVSIFYTAPTAIRSLHALGDEHVKRTSRKSLRLLGSVGEPINPETWIWYHSIVGDGRCPIVDTWWQTETGAQMISPLPGATKLKPGSATLPFLGIELALLDESGQEIQSAGSGHLVIKSPWPSQIRTVYGDHQRLIDTYFGHYKGFYFTGDGASRDEDGYYWITGRIDDVLNVSGHRLGTAEIENALVLHDKVAEAAVVGFPHNLKGQGIYCFVTPMNNIEVNDTLKHDLINLCSNEIGPIAKPDVIQWAPALPKTRSGKIMRRILRKIAEGDLDNLGDTSTLSDPGVVENLINGLERL